MLEEDLFKSQEWQNATPEKRQAFLSKIRASAKIEKDRVKKQTSHLKKLAAADIEPVCRALVYLSGHRFDGRSTYIQALPYALNVVGLQTSSGVSAKNFIKTHIEVLKLHVDENRGRLATIKQNRKAKKTPAVKPAKKVVNSFVATDEFLSTYEWRKTRMVVLKKYGVRCQCCGATPATGAVINVDHIKPRKLFPDLALDVDNLQVLCHECNHGKGNWDQTDWRPL